MPAANIPPPDEAAHPPPLHSRRSSGALRSVPFFGGRTDDELEHFERIVDRAEFAAGDVMMRKGEAGQTFLILLSARGRCKPGR
jgi:hypothetical protein